MPLQCSIGNKPLKLSRASAGCHTEAGLSLGPGACAELHPSDTPLPLERLKKCFNYTSIP